VFIDGVAYMKISVCLIAYNEEGYIIPCLDSIRPVADEIVVIDGGSEDNTVQLVTEWAKTHAPNKVKLGVSEWDNHFGDQRQKSFEAARGDWVMRIDCDETASRAVRQGLRQMLESLPPSALAVRVKQLNLFPDDEYYAADCGGWETWPRIFRNTGDLQWVGQVHEHVMRRNGEALSDIPEQSVYNWHVNIIHHGWLHRARREERERLYMSMSGSGFEQEGDLTNRQYVIKAIPMVI